jgi:MFS family permease
VPRFRRNLWLLLAQNLAVFLGIAVQALILNLYLVALGYREDFVGLVAFVQTAAIGVGAMPASWLAPRIGARRVLIGATVALGASFGLMASLEVPALLLAASAVSGIAMAHVFVPSAPYLADNTGPEERRIAFSANFAALSLASVAGSALGGLVPGLVGGNALLGYRYALLAGSLFSALGALPLLVADDTRVETPPASPPARGDATRPSLRPHPGPLPEGEGTLTDAHAPIGLLADAALNPQPSTLNPPEGEGAPAGTHHSSLITHHAPRRSLRRDMLAMAGATALMAASTGLVVAFFNVFLRDVVAAPTGQIGTVFATASIAMAPGSLLGPAAARRWGAVPMIVLPRLLSAPLILSLALLPSTLLLSGSVYALRSMLVSISQPLDNAFAMELVSPRDRARVAALRTMSWNGGWAVATGLGGLAIVSVGYPLIFATAALLTLGSVAVHWANFRGR